MERDTAVDERFARHLPLPEVGAAGQVRLAGSQALVVGAGGLGCAALLYLAAAGVGRLRVVDSDRVSPSDLNRQILYRPEVVGQRKVEVAAAALRAFHPGLSVESHAARVDPALAPSLLSGADVALDCTDNFETRLCLAAAAWAAGVPVVWASAQRFGGQLLVQRSGPGRPCLRCLLPACPSPGTVPLPAETGVFGPVVGVMGTLQALEACKCLLGAGEVHDRDLLDFDGLTGRVRTLQRHVDPACPVCRGRSGHPSPAPF